MKKRNFSILGWLLFIAVVAMGAKITDNLLIVGDQNAGVDKEIQMGDGRIKWDQAASKMQFSNDQGTSFKDIGSGAGGGGGGITLFDSDDNPDFEAVGLSPWAASGGSFTIESGSPGFGSQSGNFDASSASQNVDSSLKTIVSGLENRHCSAAMEMLYAAGSEGDYKFQVIDSGSSVLAEKDIEVTSEWAKQILTFTCPASESMRIRITSTADGGELLFDNAELGQVGFSNISQTQLYAAIRYDETASCRWTRDNASFGAFSTDADCPAPTLEGGVGTVDLTDDDLPTMVLPDLPPGLYQGIFRFRISHSSTANLNMGILPRAEGTTSFNGAECGHEITVSTHGAHIPHLSCRITFELTDMQTTTLTLHGFETGTGGMFIENDNNGENLAIELYKFPTSSAESVNLVTVGFSYDGYIDAGSDTTFTGALSESAFIELQAANYTLTDVTGDADIACVGVDNSGNTCSGPNEVAGFIIDLPSRDDWEG